MRNVVNILNDYLSEPLLVVVSAMGKMTNALEVVLNDYMKHDPIALIESFKKVEDYHWAIIRELFQDKNDQVFDEVDSLFNQLRGYIRKGHLYSAKKNIYDFEYDQIVSFGELISSAILYHYLISNGIKTSLIDVRELIKTDSTYRDAKVNWQATTGLIREKFSGFDVGDHKSGTIAITQGFLGCDPDGNTTTLGREGSDFSAAICAYALKAKEMTIWKDVPGVMNADPKWMNDAVQLETLSYREAIELAYYGASVIHPKTIKPLENANITLMVKSFLDPVAKGTKIERITEWEIPFPIYIRKTNQVLISISSRDFSFILEENLSEIFKTLSRFRVKANIMQNSAISFSVCVDQDDIKVPPLIEFLGKDYETRYNDNLELYTIRHYNEEAVNRICDNRTILMELRSRGTVQIVLR